MASRREDAIEEPLLSPGFTSYVARPIDETLVRHALPPPAPLPHSAPRALTSPPPSHHPAHFPQDPLEPSSRLGSSSSISTPRRRYHLGDGTPYEIRDGRDAKKPPSFSRLLVRPATHPPLLSTNIVRVASVFSNSVASSLTRVPSSLPPLFRRPSLRSVARLARLPMVGSRVALPRRPPSVFARGPAFRVSLRRRVHRSRPWETSTCA